MSNFQLMRVFKKSGLIWDEDSLVRGQRVRRVCEALEQRYGRPRLDNPTEVLDDLVFVALSNKSSPKMARRIYTELKKKFETWDEVLRSRPHVLVSVLKPAGLSSVKARQIRGALSRIKKDLGSCNLNSLIDKSHIEAERYLVSLPGVSLKVAKCVMLYTMLANVLPVDAHVHRVAGRLGWTSRKRADQCHDELEALVPPKRRFAFHVDCILHGRLICRPKNPKCEECCVSRNCDYFWRNL
jgi:endonuclease III